METQAYQLLLPLLLVPLLFLDRHLGRAAGADAADETGTNLTLGAIVLLSDAAVLAVFAAVYAGLRPHVMLMPEPPFAAQLALALLLGDLASYWHHRFMHRIGWLWASHVVHHQSRRIELSTGLRSHPFATLGNCLFWSPLLVVGISPAAMLLAAGLIGTWAILIHSQAARWPAALPWSVEAVLNLPSHHRIHHRQDSGAGTCNYGLLFILWDRLFGTYCAPREEPRSYGVAGAPPTGPVGQLLWHEWRRTLGLGPPESAATPGRPATLAVGVTAYLGAVLLLALTAAAAGMMEV